MPEDDPTAESGETPPIHDPRPPTGRGVRPAVEPSTEAPGAADVPEAGAPPEAAPPAIPPEVAAILSRRDAPSVPRARRIFVNRNLRLDRIEAVGFDMDYTLAVYHPTRIEALAYRLTAEVLVREKGYPRAVLDLVYEADSVIRGLVVDKELGNIFKMDRHYHVTRVHHGRRPLSKEERIRYYRKQKIRLGSSRYVWVDTLFSLPEAALYADLVDLLDARSAGGAPVDYGALYDDVREAIDQVHRDGSLKRVVRERLAEYIRKEPQIGATLHKLRSSGKKLFVLTNSFWPYTDAVMGYLLDGVLPEYPSWRGYFDLVIVGAQKPAFFGERRPFRTVDPETGEATEEAARIEQGGIYEGGNLRDLETDIGWAGDGVLYVGDHIYGDILRTKRSGMWRTAMVVQEIEAEVSYAEARAEDFGRLFHLEDLRLRIDEEIGVQKALLAEIERRMAGRETSRLASGERRLPPPPPGGDLEAHHKACRADLEQLRAGLKAVLAQIDALRAVLDRGAHPHWGMLFKEGHENSRFGDQVEAYACLYTSRVSNLLAYSPTRYFRSRPGGMPHEVDDGQA
jgi:5'-nucleotidase